MYMVKLSLEEFGGFSRKPLWIWSQFAWIKDLVLYKTTPRPKKQKGQQMKQKRKPKKVVSINKVEHGWMIARALRF